MKDFFVDDYQVLQARAHGADCILLIVATLDGQQLSDLLVAAEELSLAALVEVHTAAELDDALAAGAKLVGVNNRNLQTLAVSLETSRQLAARVEGRNLTLVAESGLKSAADLADLSRHGYHAFLVGTHLIRSGRPGPALVELFG